jgi:hypothetical protein
VTNIVEQWDDWYNNVISKVGKYTWSTQRNTEILRLLYVLVNNGRVREATWQRNEKCSSCEYSIPLLGDTTQTDLQFSTDNRRLKGTRKRVCELCGTVLKREVWAFIHTKGKFANGQDIDGYGAEQVRSIDHCVTKYKLKWGVIRGVNECMSTHFVLVCRVCR